ncbi:hypothetical protein GDO86_007126 [Hymenochirus boettgeri]|uniref:Uncharacterized protein n=1 Tax=Hymenochirus boettgeri TaxID=247094 RepID=A0A8T2IXY2_9PIPI|nr:hypothetical protein GDO86_007126 [Hymenochirus boettgeri]
MGANGSSGRTVSFGLDEDERVRVLRGVRLSDDVISRMKDSSPPKKQDGLETSGTSVTPPSSTSKSVPLSTTKNGGFHRSTATGFVDKKSEADDDLYRRYEREQAIIQDELTHLAKRERETAHERLSSSILLEKNCTNEEGRRAEQLAKELEHREAKLKHLDGFYKEQLSSIEKKNLEIYRLTAEQFHTAAKNAELRVKKRSYDPVCKDLQTEILKCYTENKQELLVCSNLAKEYRNCVKTAQKF